MNVSTQLNETDFLDSPITLNQIQPEEFERLIFHLLDEMGFSDLMWRKGGEGNSATDGGRDLEASYWRIDPLGSRSEKYWVEIKYRSRQLAKKTVQEAALNAAGKTNLDCLLIITNSTVSNQCLDWLVEFRQSHPRLQVTIWQGHDLELMLRKNPRTLAQFFSQHLNGSGKLKVIESRFGNLSILPSGQELDQLWEMREGLTAGASPLLIVAAILGESASGNLVKHPWGMYLDRETLLGISEVAFYNSMSFLTACLSHSRDQLPFIKGFSYLLQCLLLRTDSETAFRVLRRPEMALVNPSQLAQPMQDEMVELITNCLLKDLAISCSELCPKLSYAPISDVTHAYFQRFLLFGLTDQNEEPTFLILKSKDKECALSLLSQEEFCPLGERLEGEIIDEEVIERLQFARKVIIRRIAELTSNH